MLKIKSTQQKQIGIVGSRLKLEEVFVVLQITIPIVKGIIILKPSFYEDEDFYNESPSNQARIDIPVKSTQGVDGIVEALLDGEIQDVPTAKLCAKRYFERLGYEVEIISETE